METTTLASRFKALRDSREWTQAVAAVAFGVQLGTYARWERGENNPGGSAIRLLETLEGGRRAYDERTTRL